MSDFRASLPDQLRAIRADRRTRVHVGAQRMPEAVLIATAEDVPPDVRRRLITGFIANAADRIIRDTEDIGTVVVDDNSGVVFAWLWVSDPDQTMLALGDLMAYIQQHRPNANPYITLTQVLDAFELALPYGTPTALYREFRSRALSDVVKYFSGVKV